MLLVFHFKYPKFNNVYFFVPNKTYLYTHFLLISPMPSTVHYSAMLVSSIILCIVKDCLDLFQWCCFD